MTKIKKAAAYVRVSTEEQGEGASPEQQLADIKAHCEARGYELAQVFKDTENYKSGGKIVNPSGTRNDRPGFVAMLAAADRGEFQVLVAWTQDRLWRGVTYAAVDVIERHKAGRMAIDLVKETFNPLIAEFMSVVSGQENLIRKQRFAMGKKARLKAGKLTVTNPPLGYTFVKETGALVVNEDQAEVVRTIWRMIGEGKGRHAVRKHLIETGAKQAETRKRKRDWNLSVIDGILRREYYYTGIFVAKQKGGPGEPAEEFEVAIPTIIDEETYRAARAAKAEYKRYPGRTKKACLVAGMIYCEACDRLMGPKPVGGYIYMQCNTYNRSGDRHAPGCARSISQRKIDKYVWDKVWGLLTEKGKFEEAIRERAEQLKAKEGDAKKRLKQLGAELADIGLKKDKLLALHLDDIMGKEEYVKARAPLDAKEEALRRDIAEAKLLVGGDSDKLMELVEVIRDQVLTAKIALGGRTVGPRLDDQFVWRQKVLRAVVDRVIVSPKAADPKRIPRIELKFDAPALLSILAEIASEQIPEADEEEGEAEFMQPVMLLYKSTIQVAKFSGLQVVLTL